MTGGKVLLSTDGKIGREPMPEIPILGGSTTRILRKLVCVNSVNPNVGDGPGEGE
jgi:hypothetical protein